MTPTTTLTPATTPAPTTCIEVCDLRIRASHGVLPQERVVGHLFRVDLVLWADLTQAMRTDDVGDTISYADVIQAVRDEMSHPSALLEHAAARILNRLLVAFPRLRAVEVRLAKVAPPVAGAEVAECAVRLRGEAPSHS